MIDGDEFDLNMGTVSTLIQAPIAGTNVFFHREALQGKRSAKRPKIRFLGPSRFGLSPVFSCTGPQGASKRIGLDRTQGLERISSRLVFFFCSLQRFSCKLLVVCKAQP